MHSWKTNTCTTTKVSTTGSLHLEWPGFTRWSYKNCSEIQIVEIFFFFFFTSSRYKVWTCAKSSGKHTWSQGAFLTEIYKTVTTTEIIIIIHEFADYFWLILFFFFLSIKCQKLKMPIRGPLLVNNCNICVSITDTRPLLQVSASVSCLSALSIVK